MGGEGDRQAERRGGTRQRILEAAVQVFAGRGYHDATVDDIARASGNSKGGFYFHFPSKQGVFLALVEHLADQVLGRMESAIAGERGGMARVEAALSTVLQAFASHRNLARILLVEVVGLGHGFDPRLRAIRARFTDAIRRHLDRAVADGSIPPQDTETAARVWLGAINEVVVRWLYTEPAEPLEPSIPALRTLLLRSVGYQLLAFSDQSSAFSRQASADSGSSSPGREGVRSTDAVVDLAAGIREPAPGDRSLKAES